jgi:RecB family exonuclease
VNTTPQMGFDGMPRRLLQASPARLTCYLDCPRRYRFTYLDRPAPPKGPPWAHNSFGASVHTVLANWWRLPVARRTVPAVDRLLEQAWLADGYRDDAQRSVTRERAREMLVRYVATLDPYDEPVGVERTVAVKTERAALFGRIDRIDERPDDGLVVVDYKTGRHVLTVDDARTSLALAVYAVAAARTLRKPCRRVELHHLPTGRVLVWEHTEDGLARHVRRADSIAGEIADLDEQFRAGVTPEHADAMYPAVVGPICGWCDFNRSCPAASSVRPRESWAGLADPLG